MQKHIMTKNVDGTVTLDKKSIADICELIRRSPTAGRVFFFLLAYADKDNKLISNVKTISKALNLDKQRVFNAFKYLTENGFVEAYEIKLNHTTEIPAVIHDTEKYEDSDGTIWEVIGEKKIEYVLTGTYNKFIISDVIAKCSTNQSGNVLINLKGNLFYDTSLPESELGFGC